MTAGVVTVVCAIGVAIIIGLMAGVGIDDAEAIHALHVEGYSTVRILDHGVDAEDCGDGDDTYYRARATNPQGASVELTVCCGMFFSGCTLRSRQ